MDCPNSIPFNFDEKVGVSAESIGSMTGFSVREERGFRYAVERQVLSLFSTLLSSLLSALKVLCKLETP